MPENTNNVSPATAPAVVRGSRTHTSAPVIGSVPERQVELKFCECCAGLFLRHKGTHAPYCAKCAPVMRQFPIAKNKKKPCRSASATQISAGSAACA